MEELEASASQARADIDWKYIQDELKNVPSEYKEQRFYPLKHVVEIFSSPDPQQLTAEVRDREARLSELVDLVVEGYHTGFTRSIQNYSQILQLFQDSRQQMDNVRRGVANAQRQLGAQSKHLADQWHRSVALTASLSLLKDVTAVVELPARIQSAINSRDYPLAGSLLLEACTQLSDKNLQKIGALSKLRSDMAGYSNTLQRLICEQLLSTAYDRQTSDLHPGRKHNMANGRSPNSKRAAGKLRLMSTAYKKNGTQPFLNGSQQQTVLDDDGTATSSGPASTAQLVACLASLDGVADAKAFLTYHAKTQVRAAVWGAAKQAAAAAAQSYHAVAASWEAGGASGGLQLAVPHHVEVLAQKLIQAVADKCISVLASLSHVLREIAEAPATHSSPALQLLRPDLDVAGGGAAGNPTLQSLPSRRLRDFKSSKGRGKAMADAYVRVEMLHVWMQMQEEWHALLKQLLSSQLRPLGSRGAVAAKAAPNKAVALLTGVVTAPLTLLQKFDELSEHVSSKVEAALGGEKASDNNSPRRNTSVSGASSTTGQGQAGNTARDTGAISRGSKLHFTLDIQVKSLATGSNGKGGAGDLAAESEALQGYGNLVTGALGGNQGNVYLLPAVYLPLTSFLDAAMALLKPYLRESATQQGAKPTSQHARRAQELQASRLWLRDCIEDYVLESFMPQVWIDLRARCTTALEHPDALRPSPATLMSSSQVSMMASEQSEAGQAAEGNMRGLKQQKGIVPAAKFAERVLQDVASWSMAMPAFEGSFMGVAENILGRLLDSFWSTLVSLSGSHNSFRQALRYDVAVNQAVEVDARLLGPPACFCVPKPGASSGNDSLDVAGFIAATKSSNRPQIVQVIGGRNTLSDCTTTSGSPASKSEPVHAAPAVSSGDAEVELQLLIYQERSSSAEQLMSQGNNNVSRLTAIAALAESLEYLSSAVTIAAARQVSSGPKGIRVMASGRRGRGRGKGHGVRGLARVSLGRSDSRKQDALLDLLPDSLVELVHRCKALSGLCLRTIRLELQQHTAHAWHGIAHTSHMLESGAESREGHPGAGALSRSLTRLIEAISNQLGPARLAYVAAGLPPAAARMAMWVLPEIKEINGPGIERMIRSLSALQPAIMSLVPASDTLLSALEGPRDADMLRTAHTKVFDKARAYYQLLSMGTDDVIRLASEYPFRYSYSEWMAVLQVHVPGRPVTESQLAALQGLLDKAHGLTTGQKIVGAVGTVLNTVIAAPAEKVADVALDVLKFGAEGLVAGAMIPARQLGKVFKKLEAVARQQ